MDSAESCLKELRDVEEKLRGFDPDRFDECLALFARRGRLIERVLGSGLAPEEALPMIRELREQTCLLIARLQQERRKICLDAGFLRHEDQVLRQVLQQRAAGTQLDWLG